MSVHKHIKRQTIYKPNRGQGKLVQNLTQRRPFDQLQWLATLSVQLTLLKAWNP